MPPDWKVIRAAREDITDWLIHWTRYQITPEPDRKFLPDLEVLKLILKCGYLYATFAPRTPRFAGQVRNTIQGPNPAVCFTEQPLSAFIRLCKALSRYHWYGLAFDKRNIFSYGGRSVIYGDQSLLARLRDEDQYLWVCYDPIPSFTTFNSQHEYPLDWSHEREWRARPKRFYYRDWGISPEEGMAISKSYHLN